MSKDKRGAGGKATLKKYELYRKTNRKHPIRGYESSVALNIQRSWGGNRKRQSESECVALEHMRVVYLLQVNANVGNEWRPIFQRKSKRERMIHKGRKLEREREGGDAVRLRTRRGGVMEQFQLTRTTSLVFVPSRSETSLDANTNNARAVRKEVCTHLNSQRAVFDDAAREFSCVATEASIVSTCFIFIQANVVCTAGAQRYFRDWNLCARRPETGESTCAPATRRARTRRCSFASKYHKYESQMRGRILLSHRFISGRRIRRPLARRTNTAFAA
ncbi:hypothetical protein EVAR_58493_1 [Eumeta japonica]|uniref:Uncharacterized protein n=1 Tax=Eumeta variegata TaxID=151549 RepID=A0A4C1ZMF5_EUMVA|nr:hypothetical protein EVAR_58493_1 [Eumeta japonica]